jgi:hypothetical protein
MVPINVHILHSGVSEMLKNVACVKLICLHRPGAVLGTNVLYCMTLAYLLFVNTAILDAPV